MRRRAAEGLDAGARLHDGHGNGSEISLAARRFLYVIAFLVLLVFAGGVAWNLFQDRLMRAAFVPTVRFAPPPDTGAPDYTKAEAWAARPGFASDPARWVPAGVPAPQGGVAAVFFVPPTTYVRRDHWNAPIDDPTANRLLDTFVRSQASAFNDVGQIWVPRYRQATVGSFLTGEVDARRALDFAYRDVVRAFDAFLAAIPADRPIILAGHSQGSLHLTRLLADRIGKDAALRRRIIAAYVVGWPISIQTDLPAFGLPACAAADQAGCILSWQSFAEPADDSQIASLYDPSVGLTGMARRGTQILCVDPISGVQGGTSTAAANQGSLIPNLTYDDATIEGGRVPARCDAKTGLLLIGRPPEGYGRFVLKGNNYHVFDYALFWADVRADAARRLAAFQRRAP